MTTEKEPVTSIIFGTMTLGYRGYGARVHDLPTAQQMLDTYGRFGHHQLDTATPTATEPARKCSGT